MELNFQALDDDDKPAKLTTQQKLKDFFTCVPTNNKRIRWLQHALVLVSLSAVNLGVSSALSTGTNTRTWLDTLNNPSFRPPNWVFAPMWTLLYILIAFSAWRIYYLRKVTVWRVSVYLAQLFFNFIWMPIFFHAHQLFGGLIVIFLLLGSIVVMMAVFYRVDLIAMLVLIPYLLWVGFATCLNTAYWWLNYDLYGFGTWDGVAQGCVRIPLSDVDRVAHNVTASFVTACPY